MNDARDSSWLLFRHNRVWMASRSVSAEEWVAAGKRALARFVVPAYGAAIVAFASAGMRYEVNQQWSKATAAYRRIRLGPRRAHCQTRPPSRGISGARRSQSRHKLAHGAGVFSLLWHAQLLYSASLDRAVRSWDTRTGVALRVIAGHRCVMRCMEVAPLTDGKHLILTARRRPCREHVAAADHEK
jgi:hypothetical protein